MIDEKQEPPEAQELDEIEQDLEITDAAEAEAVKGGDLTIKKQVDSSSAN